MGRCRLSWHVQPRTRPYKPALVLKLMFFVNSLIKWHQYKHSYASVGMPTQLVEHLGAKAGSTYPTSGYEARTDARAKSIATEQRDTQTTGALSVPRAMQQDLKTDTQAEGALLPSKEIGPLVGRILTVEECVTKMVEDIPPFGIFEDNDESMDHGTDGDAAGAGEDPLDEESDTEAVTVVTGNIALPPVP